MFKENDIVNILTEDKAFVWDTGRITKITPESEENYGMYEITLDEGKVFNLSTKDLERLQKVGEEEMPSFIDWISEVYNDKKKLAVAIIIILAIIGGSILVVRQHHATPKIVQAVTQKPEKTQIQKWTDEMAQLEQEKADHYERQKYLRGEDKKEVSAVKKLDVKINKFKDKIHLYLTPTDDE